MRTAIKTSLSDTLDAFSRLDSDDQIELKSEFLLTIPDINIGERPTLSQVRGLLSELSHDDRHIFDEVVCLRQDLRRITADDVVSVITGYPEDRYFFVLGEDDGDMESDITNYQLCDIVTYGDPLGTPEASTIGWLYVKANSTAYEIKTNADLRVIHYLLSK